MSKRIQILLLFLITSFSVYSQLYYVNMEADTKWAQDYGGVTKIKVSWENPSFTNATERQWVKEAIQATWPKHANLEFVGWQQYDYSAKGIRIFIDDYAHPHTSGLGNKLDGKYQGMVLNFNFKGEYKCASTRTRESCIKAIAVHEFGHALGIAHEQNRKDCGCDKQLEQGSAGNFYVTPCDINSVMNYCNPRWNNDGLLSKYDIEGVQAVYGIRKSIIDSDEKKSISSIADALGPNQVWETLYLTFGGVQFIYNINDKNKEEIKTVNIAQSGYYNYTISSTSYHKDGKYYYGKGSGSVYIDKDKNYKLNILAKNQQNTNFDIYIEAQDIALGSILYKKPPITSNTGNKNINNNIFLKNGEKPASLLLLDRVKNEKFYVYKDGTIKVYNTSTKTYFECGKKYAPFYRDWNNIKWAWSFYRYLTNNMKETYVVSTTGEVWAYGTDNIFRKYGIVTYVDF